MDTIIYECAKGSQAGRTTRNVFTSSSILFTLLYLMQSERNKITQTVHIPPSAAAHHHGSLGVSKPAVHPFQTPPVEKRHESNSLIQMHQGLTHEVKPFAVPDKGYQSETGAIKAFQLKPGNISTSPVIQMVKYVRKEEDGEDGDIVIRADAYRLKKEESEVTEEQYRLYLAKKHGPQKGTKYAAPVVMETVVPKAAAKSGRKNKVPVRSTNTQKVPADLIYRGMSVNNISNLHKKKPAIFTVQNPTGDVSPEKHIVDDDINSPYLSFEAGGLSVSAGKYAPKPVDERSRPLGVSKLEGDFLKQEKSYTSESQDKYKDRDRIGLVAGIRKPKGALDYSDAAKAKVLKHPKAQELAVADKEVLVKPGKGGVAPEDVPFLAKVEKVDRDYFVKHINNQSAKKALGFFNDTYYKLQIKGTDPALNLPDFGFDIPGELLRKKEDDDGDMSDIEEMDTDLNDLDEVEDKGENDAVDVSDVVKPSVKEPSDAVPSPKKEEAVAVSSSPKPAVRERSGAEILAGELAGLIARGSAIVRGRGADASVEDRRAMQDERYAISGQKVKEVGKGKVEVPVKGKETVKELEKEKVEEPVKGKEKVKEKEEEAREKAPFDRTQWDIQDYGAEGDCLFRALNASSNPAWASALRTKIVRYQQGTNHIKQGNVDQELGLMLRSSPHIELRKLAARTRGKEAFPIEAYYKLMAFQGTWGGRAEISAFTKMKNRIVYVVESTGGITRYVGGQAANIPELTAEAFTGTKIVLYKSANHWQRINGQLAGE
jgi:hypothetical protein